MEAHARELERSQPQVQLQSANTANHRDLSLPREASCQPLQRIVLDGLPGKGARSRFRFATRYVKRYEGRCAGAEGVGLIVRRLGELIIDKGFITTRVVVPEQNLSSGVLRLNLVPGRLQQVQVDGGSRRRVTSALPLDSGDVLNLRDVEQALEQIRRVPSQNASFDISPGETPGTSDLTATMQQARRLRGVLGINDSGAQATGRIQGSAWLTLDTPTGLNDILSVGGSHDLVGQGDERGTRMTMLNYSLGWGRWQLDAARSEFDYRQTVQGYDVLFLNSGKTRFETLGLQRSLHRGQRHRTSAELKVLKQNTRVFIEGLEVENQRRETTAVEVALRHDMQAGRARIDARLAHRRGVPWLGGQRDRPDAPRDYPRWQYRITTLDLSMSLPLSRRLGWNSELRLQHSDNVLYVNEQLALGSRYSVRGFSGDQQLSAERGAYLRNTLSVALDRDVGLYVGVDVGHLGGPGTTQLPGASLSGAVLGLRGNAGRISWDAFTGRGLQAPRGISRRPVIGVQAALSF